MPLGVEGVGQAVAAFFNWWKQNGDANNREKNYRLKNMLKTEKAMEAAEKMFQISRQYKNHGMTFKQWVYLMEKYHKIYFKNN